MEHDDDNCTAYYPGDSIDAAVWQLNKRQELKKWLYPTCATALLCAVGIGATLVVRNNATGNTVIQASEEPRPASEAIVEAIRPSEITIYQNLTLVLRNQEDSDLPTGDRKIALDSLQASFKKFCNLAHETIPDPTAPIESYSLLADHNANCREFTSSVTAMNETTKMLYREIQSLAQSQSTYFSQPAASETSRAYDQFASDIVVLMPRLKPQTNGVETPPQ